MVATMISRMIGTPVFSDRTEFSVKAARVTFARHSILGRDNQIAEDAPTFDIQTPQYELYAENMSPVRGVLAIDQAMLKEHFSRI